MAAKRKLSAVEIADITQIGSSMAHYEQVESNLVKAYERWTGQEAELLDMEGAQVLEENERGIFITQEGAFAGSKPVDAAFVMRSFPFPRQIAVQMWHDWQRSLPTADERRGAVVWGEMVHKQLGINNCKGHNYAEIARKMIHAKPAQEAEAKPTANAKGSKAKKPAKDGKVKPASKAKPATAPESAPAPTAGAVSAAAPPKDATAPTATAGAQQPAGTKDNSACTQQPAAAKDNSAGAQQPAVSRDLSPEKIAAGDAHAQDRPIPEATPESATDPVPPTPTQSPLPKPNNADTPQQAGIGSAAPAPDGNLIPKPKNLVAQNQAGIGSAAATPDSISLPKPNCPDAQRRARIGAAAEEASAQGNRINERDSSDEQGFSTISMPPARPAAPTSGTGLQGGVGNVVNPDARIGNSTNTQPVPNRPAPDPGRPTQRKAANSGRLTRQNPGRPTSGRPTHPDLSSPAGQPTPSPDRNPAPAQDPDNEKRTQPERKTAMSQKERSSQAPKSKCFVVMASGAKGAKPVMVLTEQEDALDMAEALEAANAVLAESPAYDVVEAILRH